MISLGKRVLESLKLFAATQMYSFDALMLVFPSGCDELWVTLKHGMTEWRNGGKSPQILKHGMTEWQKIAPKNFKLI